MKSLKQYFNFSKKDTIGAITLVLLIITACLIPEFYPVTNSRISIKYDSSVFQDRNALDSSEMNNHGIVTKDFHHYSNSKNYSQPGYIQGELFRFDPNTLSLDGWKRLGLNENKIKTIIHYREKGGHFYKQEDVQKIWGLPAGFYDRIRNYIDIRSHGSVKYLKETNRPTKIISIDINEADTTEFIAL
ncbi:MAG: helix-hairpin-helix domain-containing protein, partial [Flavisolibacter sp.]